MIESISSLAVHGWQEYIQFSITIFAMLNPFTNAIIYCTLTKSLSKKERSKIILKMTLTIFTTLLLIIWTGNKLLFIFGLDIGTFRIAGGIIAFLYGFSLLGLFNDKPVTETNAQLQTIAIVPLAIPLSVGPGTIAATMTEIHNTFDVWHEKLFLTFDLFILSIIVYLIFFYAFKVQKILGETGLTIVKKLMGLFLVSIGVQMVVEGLIEVFPVLVK